MRIKGWKKIHHASSHKRVRVLIRVLDKINYKKNVTRDKERYFTRRIDSSGKHYNYKHRWIYEQNLPIVCLGCYNTVP